MLCPESCMHRQHIYLPVRFGPEEVGVFMRDADFFQVPSAGDYLRVLDGQPVRIENVLWKQLGAAVDLFCFAMPVDDPDDAVETLKAQGWVEVDQHGDPIQDTPEDGEAEPSEPVAVEAPVV